METALIVIIIQSAITFFLLWSNRKSGSADFYLLMLIVAILLHSSFKYTLWLIVDDNEIFNKVHGSFSFLYGPLLLFYFQRINRRSVILQKTFIHYVPFLIVSVFNVIVVWQVLDHQYGPLIDVYSLVSLTGTFLTSVYCVYIFPQIRQLKPSGLAHGYKLKIVQVICIMQVISVIFLLLVIVTGHSNQIHYRYVLYGMTLIMLVLMLHYRLRAFQQDFELFDDKVDTTNALMQVVGKKYQSSALQDEQRQQIVETLTTAMAADQLFLDSDLSLESLATQLDVPKHHITEVLNEHLHTNFYQFLNRYRVDEAQRLIKTAGYDANLTAIGFESGFKSKSTFNKYFKDATGLSPSEYRHQFVQPQT
jgi:AraC-like DNA-binding protein